MTIAGELLIVSRPSHKPKFPRKMSKLLAINPLGQGRVTDAGLYMSNALRTEGGERAFGGLACR